MGANHIQYNKQEVGVTFHVNDFMESAAMLKEKGRHKDILKKYGPTPSLTKAGQTRVMHPGLPNSKGWMRNLPCPCQSGKKFKKKMSYVKDY